MRVVSVVGNRPQFVKAAPLHLALAPLADVVMVDTGQHYDHGLAGIFYDELGIAPPAHRLEVGSGTHAETTARVLEGIEPVLAAEAPDWVVVYGDTNSTLAAALAAVKLGLPVAHVEAGLRSFDRAMPEEINRVLVDAVADLLLCPSGVAVRNLAAEGVARGVHVVGDVMADAARLFGPLADRVGRPDPPYVLATIHREANTRQPELGRLVTALSNLGGRVILPLHPRTRAAVAAAGLEFGPEVEVREPAGYLEFTALLRGARALVTDSGGAQKEAYFHGIPCVTLRDTTEWVETVESGWNALAGDDAAAIRAAVARPVPAERPELYGDGHAAERIAAVLADAQTRSGDSPDGSTR
ncbi:MAG: UDP-GlcNAc3NAcA epimerase [Gaiellaceae bacterium]|nr:UDP-GlcNAc3NAcA epimerase [Gaiellaceae bacterium]